MVTGANSIAKVQRRFLSLKWKAFWLNSALLSLIFGGFIFGSSVYLQDQFESSRRNERERYLQQIHALEATTGNRLTQLANMVVSLQKIAEAMASEKPDAVSNAFESVWWNLQVDSGVESVGVFSPTNEPLLWLGDPNIPGEILQKVRSSQEPEWAVNCWMTCEIAAAAPVIVPDKGDGVVAFVTNFSDIIRDFHQTTHTHAGIAIRSNERLGETTTWLPEWGTTVVAMSNASVNLPLLVKVAQNSKRDLAQPNMYYRDSGGKSFEIVLSPMHSKYMLRQGEFIFISDVTEEIEALKRARYLGILYGILGLGVAECLLLLILWGPLNRLRLIAAILPQLATNTFSDVRQKMAELSRRTGLRDESDVLNTAAINLTFELEQLQSELTERAEQLENEKDFVTGLLNTAHALILTQDFNGRLSLVNDHATWLTGFSEAELLQKNFFDLIALDYDLEILKSELAEMARGERIELQHECGLVRKDGSAIYMAWYHSVMPDRGQKGHNIMTIALDISERKEAEDRLGWLASHDPLTGLFNRRRFTEELEQQITAAARFRNTGALLYFDLDQFKDVNDTSGHQVGDQLLRRVSDTLRANARDVDVIARLGGDEFAMIVQQTSRPGIENLAERLCQELTKIEVVGAARVHRVSSSIGIALFPEHGEFVDELLANADIAMYQAKEAGRNGWHVFEPDELGRQQVQERVYWNEKVKQALAHDLITMHFQPILDLQTGEISHYEALLRVPDDKGNPLSPSKFIQSAERSGLIQDIDRRILRKVIGMKAELESRGLFQTLAVNLSGISFRNPHLIDHIRECLDTYRIRADQLIFEITETAAVADVSDTAEKMRAIKEFGCQFALDDFGVGFSSMYYLRQLPVDYVKLDGSFIRNLHQTPDDQVLVRALVEVAKAFGKKAIAEFVEHEETLDILRTLGVEYAQGYYIDRPKPLEVLLSQEETHSKNNIIRLGSR